MIFIASNVQSYWVFWMLRIAKCAGQTIDKVDILNGLGKQIL